MGGRLYSSDVNGRSKATLEVLIVEDDNVAMALVRDAIVQEGFEVLCAETVAQGRERIASDQPTVCSSLI